MTDQAVVSGGNFVTTIFLARHLLPAEYGTFALVYGTLLFLHTVHSALIVYPISVKGASSSTSELRSITWESVVLTTGLAVCLACVVSLVLALLGHAVLVVWVVLAMALWQVQETLRRGLMAHLRHSEALFGDCVLYAVQLGMLVATASAFPLTLDSVFLAIAAGAASAGVVHGLFLGVAKPSLPRVLNLAASFGQLGRWALAANLVNAVTPLLFPWLLARNSLASAAAFQALINVLAFTNPVGLSISNLMIPEIAGARSKRFATGLSFAFKYVRYGLLLLGPAFLTVLIFPHAVLSLFYHPTSPYIAYALELRILVAAFLLQFIGHVLGAYHFGKENAAGVLKGQSIGSVTALLLGIPLTWTAGLLGATVAFLAANLSRCVALLIVSPRGEKPAPFALMSQPGRGGEITCE